MAYPQFGTVQQQNYPYATGRPSSVQDPFQAALLSAAQLRDATTPKPVIATQQGGQTTLMPAAPATRTETVIQAAAPLPLQSATAIPGTTPPTTTPAPAFVSANTPSANASAAMSSEGGRDRSDMGVVPGDPNRTDYYKQKAAEYSAASSRWHGNITDADVRNFDTYAIEYRKRTGKNPAIWDWLAAGRPVSNGDYYDDKAVEYNSYDTPWKGTINRNDVVNFQLYVKALRDAGNPTPNIHITDWLNMGRPDTSRITRGSEFAGWGVNNAGTTMRDAPAGYVRLPSGALLPASPATAVPPTGTGGGAGTGGGNGDGAGTGTTTTTGTGTTTTTTPPPDTTPVLGDFNESLMKTISEVESRYQPSFQRAQQDLQDRLLQTGAVSGAINSGGFTDVVGDELTGLIGQQSAQLGEEISKQTINATQLAMQKYVAELNDAFQHLQLKTNADLETKAQELQKYGIDKNDFMEKYKADLALKGQMYSADAQVNAASAQAAASQAASKYNADRDYQLGLVNADVTREGNIFDGYIRLAQLGPEWAKWILGSDPFSILTGGQVPGDVVVRP